MIINFKTLSYCLFSQKGDLELYISFPKKIKGKQQRLSVTIPLQICEDYGLQPGDFVSVTLEDKPKNPTLKVQFNKRISKCGGQGRILYIPKKVVIKHNLQRDMKILVTLEEV